MTTKRTPRQALSARQVDRVEKELVAILALMEAGHLIDVNAPRACPICRAYHRLTRLLASVRRSERRG